MATNADESGDLDALIALYCADREKVATLANERLALLAVQMTYLGLAIIALGGRRPIGGEWVAAFAAAPLWFMNAHHQILVAAALTRSRSVTILEDRLFLKSGIPAVERNQIGHRSGALIRLMSEQPLAFKLQSSIAYAGVGAVLLTFTGYTLIVTASIAGWSSPPVILAALFYAGFITVSAIGWHRTAHLPRLPRFPDDGVEMSAPSAMMPQSERHADAAIPVGVHSEAAEREAAERGTA